MKRVILTESEKKQILKNHGLLFESTGDQQVMMNFKNEFMGKSDSEVADGLEKIKSAPGVSDDDKRQLDTAISQIRGNGAFKGTVKSMVSSKFDKYISETPDTAKSILCYLIKENPQYGNSEINSFCSGKEEKPIEKKDEIKIDTKKEDKPEIKKVESKPKDTGSFMNPYGGGADTSPGSFMNPYGS